MADGDAASLIEDFETYAATRARPGPKCPICTHPLRETIDELLTRGKQYVAITDWLKQRGQPVPPNAVGHHWRVHGRPD